MTDLDEEIAMRLFGWPQGHFAAICAEPPHYSSDIGDAWQVVEEMQRRGFGATLDVPRSGRAICRLWSDWHMEPLHFAAATMPEAICGVALLALDSVSPHTR